MKEKRTMAKAAKVRRWRTARAGRVARVARAACAWACAGALACGCAGCGAAAGVGAGEGASGTGTERSIYLNFPGFLENFVARVLPRGVVDATTLPTPDTTATLPCTDRELDDAMLALQRPVKINIHNLDEGLAIVEGIGNTDELTVVGSFVITDEMLALIQAEVDRLASVRQTPSFLLLDLETGAGLAYRIDKSHYSASSIKSISMCALCYYAPEAFGANHSTIKRILVESHNDLYYSLYTHYVETVANRWRARARLGNQQQGRTYTYYSTREFAQLWLVNYDYLSGEGETQDTLREWMQDTLASAFADELGEREGYTVCSKAGWEYGDEPACNEGGIVETPGGTYLLCVMTDKGGRPNEHLRPLVALLDDAYQAYAPDKERG